MDKADASVANRYLSLIEKVFFDHYKSGDKEIYFNREELVSAAKHLGIKLPKNLGDVVYSVRYRTALPKAVLELQPKGYEWTIEGTGRARYAFRLARISRIAPNLSLAAKKIPDATPKIIATLTLSEKQALLAKIRFNELIDVFLGTSTHSLQNNFRTSVEDIGQIEIDEIYIGVAAREQKVVVPVQAKSNADQLSAVQTKQDIACCQEKFPGFICRAVAAQFMPDGKIALFELEIASGTASIVKEAHYFLIQADQTVLGDLAMP